MNDRIVDTVSRDAAAAVTRRASLLSIGGAAVAAALGGPALAKPGASDKRARKRCLNQTSQCRAAIAEYCPSLEAPGVCAGFLSPCCDSLAQCNAAQSTACFLSFLTP